jgi:hypothetical protein
MIYQDRLGTNIGKTPKKRAFPHQADMAAKVQSTLWSAASQIYLNYQVDTQTFNTVRNTPLFEPFVYINDHFTKTGSGQT